jgi:chaperonin GroEL
MTSHTELLFRDEARAKLLAGAGALADAVRGTLGPESRSVLLERKWGTPLVCDDGVTIAKQVKLKDPVENLGAQLLRDAAVQTGDTVGDGTTTSTLLAHAMFSEAVRNVVVGTSAVGIKRGLERGLLVAVEALRGTSRPVKDRTDTAHVAAVSAHGDATIGQLVADAVEKVGPEGIVEVEEAKGTETTLDVVEGMQLDKGFLSPYFVTDPERMEAVLDRPLILLVDRKVAAVAEILPVLEEAAKAGRSILVVAESVDGEALAALVVNKLRGVIAACAVKAPGFGERRRAILGDIGVLTGTQPVSDELGRKLESVTIEELGSAERVVVTKDDTTIIGGAGDSAAVTGRCDDLRRQINDTTSDYDREKLEERLAKLSGGVALIRVGAASEAELKRLKDAFDDAISSTKAALAEGIVPGGGAALLRVVAAVAAEEERCDGAERIGVHVLRKALEAPARQIARNAGIDEGPVVEKVQAGTGFYGFDAHDHQFTDLDQRGIIDPTKVVRIALENAVTVAGTLLLVEATLVEVEEPQSQAPSPMPEMM